MMIRGNNPALIRLVGNLLNFLFLPFYKMIFRGKIKKKIQRKQYYFTICGMFKDEGPFLREWVEYHRLIGVDHIYLYNNNSTDNYMKVLQPYLQSEFVTLTDWSESHSQLKIYRHCYDTYGKQASWIAFIDLDEFICPKYCTDIKEYARKFEGYPVVFMFWRMFGTAGVMEHDYSKLVIEQYTTCWEKPDFTGKYFISTDESFVLRDLSVHRATVWVNFLLWEIPVVPIADSGRFLFYPYAYTISESASLFLNHYFSKAFSLYQKKIGKGSGCTLRNEQVRKKESFFWLHENRNISKNYIIFRFLTRLKIQLSNSTIH